MNTLDCKCWKSQFLLPPFSGPQEAVRELIQVIYLPSANVCRLHLNCRGRYWSCSPLLSPPPRYIREKRSLTPWLWIWKCILLMLNWHCNFCSHFLQESYLSADKHVWAQIDSQWLHGGLSSLVPCVWLQMELTLQKNVISSRNLN